MKKKNKIIIAIIIALILLIPLVAFAAKEYIFVPQLNETEINEANQKERERLLAEKEEYFSTHSNAQSKTTESPNANFSEEELATFKQEREHVENVENKVKEIMNRCYPNEFNQIVADSENSSSGGLSSVDKGSIPEAQKRLFDIKIRAWEEKNLSNEDKEVLRYFLEQTQSTWENDISLKTRIDKLFS